MNLLFYGGIALVLLVTGCHGLEFNVSRNDQNSGLPKVGGYTAGMGEFPSQVSIKYRYSHLCGGVILDSRHILTAASCLVSNHNTLLDKKHLTILAGDIELTSSTDPPKGSRQTKQVINIYVHKSFNTVTRDNNIAVIKVDSTIEFTTEVDQNQGERFLVNKATHQTTSVPNGISCSISGWASGEVGPHDNLRGNVVNIIDHKYCNPVTSTKLKINTKSTICGVSSSYLCEGDMGGGLICNGELTAIGSSVSDRETLCHSISSFTEILPYKDWINEAVARTDEGNEFGDTFNGSGILTGSALLVLIVSAFSIM